MTERKKIKERINKRINKKMKNENELKMELRKVQKTMICKLCSENGLPSFMT